MKYCPQCSNTYTDLVEVCPHCDRVLVIKRRKAAAKKTITSHKKDTRQSHSIIFTGKSEDAEFINSILASHDIPSETCSPAENTMDDYVEVCVPSRFADAAADLLADIYSNLFEMAESEILPENTGVGVTPESPRANRLPSGLKTQAYFRDTRLLRILLYLLIFALCAIGLFTLGEWLF